ncbi:MAG: putative VWA domain-containing protein [Streblomastix strix]|uniref:Putative VWA domain-containing protein n=1 Tax=Streblomastix strix TaxID=222440 RepID=A0A5J4WPH3_9EUKA|nr:MAG: putative VWA domain-containing protein [Streblomastix strix]
MSDFLRLNADYGARAISSTQNNVRLDILITVVAPQISQQHSPVSYVLVLDKSGSMKDDNKLPCAIKAVEVLIDQLDSRDKIGIIEFDSQVAVRLPLTSPHSKEQIRNILSGINAMGQTNISDALQKAQQILLTPSAQGTKRIILLSDGQANRGIKDSDGIGNVAGSERESNVCITSIGLGTDYNEDTMLKVAQKGGGNFYHVREAIDLVGIFQAEMRLAKDFVTSKTKSKLLTTGSVNSVKIRGYGNRTGNATKQRGSQWSLTQDEFVKETIIDMNDFTSGEQRQILLELIINPRQVERSQSQLLSPQRLQLGVFQLQYCKFQQGTIEQCEVPLFVMVDDNVQRRNQANELAAETIERVQAEVLQAESDEQHDRAMEELERGNVQSARQILMTHNSKIQQYVSQTELGSRRVTPSFKSLQSQTSRFANTLQQLNSSSMDSKTRRDMHLQSVQDHSQRAQGLFSSAQIAQTSADAINAMFRSQQGSQLSSQLSHHQGSAHQTPSNASVHLTPSYPQLKQKSVSSNVLQRSSYQTPQQKPAYSSLWSSNSQQQLHPDHKSTDSLSIGSASQSSVHTTAQVNRLIVRNIDSTISSPDLYRIFKKYNPISLDVKPEGQSGQTQVATISFSNREATANALSDIHGVVLKQKQLKVELDGEQQPQQQSLHDGHQQSYKDINYPSNQQQQYQIKQSSSLSQLHQQPSNIFGRQQPIYESTISSSPHFISSNAQGSRQFQVDSRTPHSQIPQTTSAGSQRGHRRSNTNDIFPSQTITSFETSYSAYGKH